MILPLYVGALVLGGMLVLASAFGFGKDVEAGDADGPEDFAHGADAAAIFGLFATVRFWTFTLASFGATGLLTSWAEVPTLLGVGIAVLVGLAIGISTSLVFRAVAAGTVDSSIDARKLAGREAEVLLAIPPHGSGKIRVAHQGQTLDLPARAPAEGGVPRGSRVMVVAVRDGVAEVTGIASPSLSQEP